MKKEQRRYKRTLAQNKVQTHNWEKGIEENLSDVSRSGCRIDTNLIYDIGDIIILNIKGEYMIGTIVRSNHRGYGITFTELSNVKGVQKWLKK